MLESPRKKRKTATGHSTDASDHISPARQYLIFAPLAERRKWEPVWREEGSLSICEFRQGAAQHCNEHEKVKLAAFDLDTTLIKTRLDDDDGVSIRRAQGPWDWTFLVEQVKPRLTELVSEGYRLVLFTNDAQFDLQSSSPETGTYSRAFKDLFRGFLIQLALPVICYVAKARDHYFKPMTGMLDHFMSTYHPEQTLSSVFSFFVGCEAGYEYDDEDWWWDPVESPMDDCSDRKFALNAGLQFHERYQFFEGRVRKHFWWSDYCRDYSLENDFDVYTYKSDFEVPVISLLGGLELILLIGLKGSGKTAFFYKSLATLGFARVHQEISAAADCELSFNHAAELLKAGKNVVVDGRNSEFGKRLKWIKFCQRLGVPIRAVLMDTPQLVRQHNIAMRVMTDPALRGRKSDDLQELMRVPDSEDGFRWHLEWFEEGRYHSVIKIPFVPDPDKKAWRYRYS